jgi:hypothetical protein
VNWNVVNSHWDPLVAGSFFSGNGSGDRTADLTNLVQEWADGAPNYGILLEEDPAYRTQWRSSEEGTAERRPRLQVCFSSGGSSTSASSASSSTSASSASSSTSASSASSSTSASSATSSSSSSTGSAGTGGSGTPVCTTVSRGVFGTVRDATVWQNTPAWNDSANSSNYTGRGTDSTAGNRATVLWFDLSFMPVPSTVLSSTLTLNQGYKVESSTVRLHQVLVPWAESTVSWNVVNSHWDPLVASSLFSGNNSGDRTTDLTNLVQEWANGAPNYGILLEEDPAYRTQWRSSEESTIARRPRLQVCYSH